jgi:hypothetical protein
MPDMHVKRDVLGVIELLKFICIKNIELTLFTKFICEDCADVSRVCLPYETYAEMYEGKAIQHYVNKVQNISPEIISKADYFTIVKYKEIWKYIETDILKIKRTR